MSQFYGLGSYTVNQLYSHARKFHEVCDSLLVVNILSEIVPPYECNSNIGVGNV